MQLRNLDPAAVLLWSAAAATILEAIRRGIVKPLRRFYSSALDLVERWRQLIADVSGLKDVMIEHITRTDKRLTRLEEAKDMRDLIDRETAHQTTTALAHELAAALRRRRSDLDPDLPEHAA